MKEMTDEQWDTLTKIAETCLDTQAFRCNNPENLDDAGLYTLMTGFMFLYQREKKKRNLQ